MITGRSVRKIEVSAVMFPRPQTRCCKFNRPTTNSGENRSPIQTVTSGEPCAPLPMLIAAYPSKTVSTPFKNLLPYEVAQPPMEINLSTTMAFPTTNRKTGPFSQYAKPLCPWALSLQDIDMT